MTFQCLDFLEGVSCKNFAFKAATSVFEEGLAPNEPNESSFSESPKEISDHHRTLDRWAAGPTGLGM